MATIGDVSKMAGVSKTTVSRYLNEKREGHMAAETCRRIQQAIDALGYTPSVVAQSLKTKFTKMVGLVVHDMTNPFLQQLIQGVEAQLQEADTNLMLCSSHLDLDRETACIRMLNQRQADGILLVGLDYPVEHIVNARSRVPIVLLERDAPNHEFDMLKIDNRSGARAAIRHLIEAGHTKIAHVQGALGAHPAVERFESYRDCLCEAGLPLKKEWVFQGDYKQESGYAAMAYFFAMADRPTAVFFANDLMALGALRYAQDNGLGIPGDIAVVGFDDIETASLVTPALTTVRQPIQQMAAMAAKILLRRISDGGITADYPAESVLLDTRLIVRKSG